MTKEELDYIIEQLTIAHNNHRVRVEFRTKDAIRFYVASVMGSLTILALAKVRRNFKDAWKAIREAINEDIKDGDDTLDV